MPDGSNGKSLSDGLLDYPLPTVPGTRDYVFYFAKNEGYGVKARQFFQRFYPHHHVVDPGVSLEALIATLYADVTQHSIQRIREIVIVAHGTSLGLNVPLLSSSADPNLTVLTAYSMALLQHQMRSGTLEGFKAKRATVVGHLHADSWVTVRACRFGQSTAGMYALYSFFGGNADAYAPKLYQVFADQPIVEGMRYPSRLAVHEHMVRQRFLPRDVHSPDRQDLIVRAQTDPGGFAEPFTLSTRTPNGLGPPEYGALITSLDAQNLSAALKSTFHTNGFDLSTPKVIVEKHGGPWTIRDSVAHPDADTTYTVEYFVFEDDDKTTGRRSLRVQASLPEMRAAQERVLLQCFFDDAGEDAYNGVAVRLASSRDDDAANAESKVEYVAFRALLDGNGASGNTFNSGALDLREYFKRAGVELADSATIVRASAPPADPLAPQTWTVGPDDDGTSYLVNLDHPYVQAAAGSAGRAGVDWIREHRISAVPKLSKKALLRMRDAVIAHYGVSPDSPGVELAASLDRLSTDDLVDLITYLRAPYRPRNVAQLWHAVQAVKRKGNYTLWMQTRSSTGAFPDFFPTSDPLTELSLGEDADKKATIYDIEFDVCWAEVKASNRTPFAFQADLFTDESLASRFGIAEEIEHSTRVSPSIEDDSPYSDADELSRLESLGFNQYLAIQQKRDPTPATSWDCADFRAAVMNLKDLSDAPVAQLGEALAGKTTADGTTSYLKIILSIRSKYAFLRNFRTLTELDKLYNLPELSNAFYKLPKIVDPTSPYDLAKTTLKHVFKYAKQFGKFELAAEFFGELGQWDFVITIPMKMWLEHVAELQVDAIKQAIAVGQMTAYRTWLERLIVETHVHENDFPDEPAIDLSEPVIDPFSEGMPTEPYYLAAYHRQQNEFEGLSGMPPTRFDLFPEGIKIGFDIGSESMRALWPTISRYVQQATEEVLRQTSLGSCEVDALLDAGLLDVSKLKAAVVRAFATRLLDELPNV